MYRGSSKLVFKKTTLHGVELEAIGVEFEREVIYEFTRRTFSGTALRDLDREIALYWRDPFEYIELIRLNDIQNRKIYFKEELGMPEIDINLNEVVEKPPLHALGPGPYVFLITKTSLEQSQTVNKRTGNKEWMIRCALTPQEQPTYSLNHSFSLSPGALESSSAAFSVKKFFTMVGFQWGSDGKFNSDAMIGLKFIGTVKAGSEPQYTNIDQITGPA